MRHTPEIAPEMSRHVHPTPAEIHCAVVLELLSEFADMPCEVSSRAIQAVERALSRASDEHAPKFIAWRNKHGRA